MFETMIDANGVGLAAPQVGIAKRFFVVISDDDVKRVFINPQIVATSKELVPYDEGCLSLPGFDEEIVRPAKVTIQALNEFGKPFTLETDGLESCSTRTTTLTESCTSTAGTRNSPRK